MKRLALVAGAALLCMALAAPALSESSTESTTTIDVTDPCAEHPRPAAEHRQLARRVYRPGNWRRKSPLGPGRRRQVELLRSCVDPAAIAPMRRLWNSRKRAFQRYRLYRNVAPYRSPPGVGSGPRRPADKRWWAIPSYIVCGESRYRFDPWENDDGAYQIIDGTWAEAGGRRFASSAGDASPLEQHIIASILWPGTAWYGSC